MTPGPFRMAPLIYVQKVKEDIIGTNNNVKSQKCGADRSSFLKVLKLKTSQVNRFLKS